MIYLTSQHTTPPSVIEHEGIQYPVKRLIELEDTATLALLGVYPHVYTDEPAPLGVEWQYNDAESQWEQIPKGTQAERDLASNRVKWKRQAEWRKQQAAQKIIDSPDSDPSDKVLALQQLTGV